MQVIATVNQRPLRFNAENFKEKEQPAAAELVMDTESQSTQTAADTDR